MSAELVKPSATLQKQRQACPPVPWRDPHSVLPEALGEYIQTLEAACLENPCSADLRLRLGMAYAVNGDVHKSMDALQLAVSLAPEHFWAQLKYSELLYRLGEWPRAEAETKKAIDLAPPAWQLSLARTQLREIRRQRRDNRRNLMWDAPLTASALVLSAMLLLTFAVMMWL